MKINEAWEQLYKAAMSRGRESQLNYISLIIFTADPTLFVLY